MARGGGDALPPLARGWGRRWLLGLALYAVVLAILLAGAGLALLAEPWMVATAMRLQALLVVSGGAPQAFVRTSLQLAWAVSYAILSVPATLVGARWLLAGGMPRRGRLDTRARFGGGFWEVWVVALLLSVSYPLAGQLFGWAFAQVPVRQGAAAAAWAVVGAATWWTFSAAWFGGALVAAHLFGQWARTEYAWRADGAT